MKIYAWNVNGLRAVLRKGALDWLHQAQPDVLCLQEIKMKPAQLDESGLQMFVNYQTYWHPAERPGYSGVATFTSTVAKSVDYGLGQLIYDVEGRVLSTQIGDFWLINVYVPNGGRDNSRVPYKLDFYQALLDYANGLREKGIGVIIVGDINTAHQEIDLRHPKENSNKTGFLLEEREWISHYIENGYVDIYRYLYPERIQYTWWSYPTQARKRNVGWRIDFFLVTQNLIPRISDAEIYDQIMGSDHCPIGLTID